MHAFAAGLPVWPDETTAIGTVALALATFVAIIVTILITRRDRQNSANDAKTEREVADGRLERQIQASASHLQVERDAADERLQRQLDASNARFQTERDAADERLQRQLDASTAQFQAERDALRDQEQLAEAYLVQVVPGRMDPSMYGSRITTDADTPITCPCVIIANRGHYTITDIQTQFSTDGRNMLSYGNREHFSALRDLPTPMATSLEDEPDIRLSTLTPIDVGLRFAHDAIAVRNLFGSYPIVRRQDHWGQIWEYKLGLVRKVLENEQWTP